jgi:hypothetical protein
MGGATDVLKPGRISGRGGTSLAGRCGVKPLRTASLVLFAAIAVAPGAHAQTDSRFAIGGNFLIGASDHESTEDRAHANFYPEVLWRFGDIQPGWGPHWGLYWYAVDIDRPIGGTSTMLGKVHIRPIMAGYGYTWLRGRNAISANALAGYAFATMKLDDDASAAYQSRLGVQVTDSSASNPFVFRPEIDFWHDINNLFGVNVNVGYIIARPDVRIATTTGIDKRTARADQFQVRVGLVYSIF